MTTGTREWADSNVNVLQGCSNNCRYCYAAGMAVRFKRATRETWPNMSVNTAMLDKGFKKRGGRVMFPTSHDIPRPSEFPAEYAACKLVLTRLLAAGNEVLVTSKPNVEAIDDITDSLDMYRPQIQFRFTITSIHGELIYRWEPGAPTLDERIAALKLATQRGFATSVSIEPCLDSDPRPLVALLAPHVSGTIWLGPMNHVREAPTTPDDVANWHKWFQGESQVKFKH